MSDFYSVSSPPIPHSVFKEAFTLPTLPSPIFSPEKSGRTILHRSFRARGFLERELKSKSRTENVEACKQGKNRERTSKTGRDELNRGYFDDMSELKQHGIALANKILIPGIAARKFPAVDVIYSDGRKSKLAIVFDASGVDASKLAVPEGSLVCLSFRANSQEEANSEQQTVIGSSNVPETLDEPVEFQTESGGTRRGRGHMLLKDLYYLNPVERVKVSRNSHGQPVGSEARLLAGYLGIIAPNVNMFPINYESWHHMPDSDKNQALDNIKERFDLEVSDDYIKKALGKKLRNVPPRMLRYQWEDAVRFWNSKKR
ncbi:restriction of telomere capping 1 [Gossypium arboreum]|uniref:Restriction of telomere capping 1 n=1 Tax=Gossypium arboreum TaxID=29729 RepID=A0A0B0PUI3_GOSAR|nr:restriction of telomere capping 1 [Gossypium arboreum]